MDIAIHNYCQGVYINNYTVKYDINISGISKYLDDPTVKKILQKYQYSVLSLLLKNYKFNIQYDYSLGPISIIYMTSKKYPHKILILKL